jgi:CheY-like chemotaxis protein
MTEFSSVSIDQRPLHILLVDDDQFLIDLMREVLTDMGALTIQSALNGLEGLAAYRNSTPKPNLIICDLCMPQLGGMEFLSHLSREACTADVLIMSGYNLTPPDDANWTLGNYSGPVLNLAEKLARIQGLNVRATFEKPITHEKIAEMISLIQHIHQLK